MSTTAKKSATKGVRYTDAQKKEVTDFVTTFNAANGRGGQSKAAGKFNIFTTHDRRLAEGCRCRSSRKEEKPPRR